MAHVGARRPMKRSRDDLVDTPEELRDVMNNLQTEFELFDRNNFFINEKNKRLTISYDLAEFQGLDDLITEEDYTKALELLEETCMNVCRNVVDLKRCKDAITKISYPDNRTKTIMYPVEDDTSEKMCAF